MKETLILSILVVLAGVFFTDMVVDAIDSQLMIQLKQLEDL